MSNSSRGSEVQTGSGQQTSTAPSPSSPPQTSTTITVSNSPPPTSTSANLPSATAPSTSTPPAQPPPPTTSSSPPAETTPTPTIETPTPAAPTTSTSTTPGVTPVVPTTSTPEPTTSDSIVTVTPPNSVTTTKVVVGTTTPNAKTPSTSATVSSTSTATPINPGGDGAGGGLSQPAKVAIGVVVPIAAIALLALLGLFWWRKRRARQESEEERRKEVEDYSYNPNADPTVPAVGLGTDAYEMRDEGGSGYRGWGSTTAAGSMGRKTSTTMSGGMTAGAFSDGGGHNRGNLSETKTEPTMDGSPSPDGEILGAMGPSVANNRGGDVHRGPSNASSSYSATGRSEGSDVGIYANGGAYYEQYGQNPYADQRAQELGGQAVIRDNPARRNPRIENPAHWPQQSAGIAQNF
ncbi:hypothetical protein NOR_05407 [Metarhizium rileyi]|uniref:Uncharacterized protein n=1 Tax=Metarhizium rileyi (strain RCEF 4871) TaxID=1649241 RepID=A0A167CLE2_METRR|nr:hypothetical protein NOR_05407 [Metarhizium rileyi RCEF 4871]